MPNAFDRLREQCRQFTRESEQYSWFIKNKLLNGKELEGLLSWYEHPYRKGNVDNDGRIRLQIARQLPANVVLKYFDLNRLDDYPRALRKYLKHHFTDIVGDQPTSENSDVDE
jgi:hypothetical protein